MSSKDERISLVERAVKRMQEEGGATPEGSGKRAAPIGGTAKKKDAKLPPRKTPAQLEQEKRAEQKARKDPRQEEAPAVKPSEPASPPPVPPVAPTPATPESSADRVVAPPVSPPPQAEAQRQAPPAPPLQGPDDTYMQIDIDMLRKNGMVTPNSGRTHLVEEMRAIKRPIIRRAFKSERLNGTNSLNNVVMITSCRSGEGKTFNAINLAMSIAMERDLYVMLIDTDVYRRGINHLLGIPDEKAGLVDLVLDSDLGVSDVLLRTNIDNLSVLPAGTQHPHATELLASQRMVEIIKDISSRYPDRMVIIDTPPVLASSEPRVLAAYVGQVVMVVEEGGTSRPLVENALDALGDSDKVRFILNKHRGRSKTDTYYGYSREAYS
ncbi:XrtA-associated tyrosine autokinase [Aestuariispira ectoiniformans]|uniref:XrtA-associated tyrosine autokinase n=1 Tax=Aestuariispira ectoiniformans TaxID=2775080 RepID=UPI00223C3E15|nr:XrtA-associated tyrosine autokinase [Aestuariispira ectoiniformans]